MIYNKIINAYKSPKNNNEKIAIIISGIPASGKTTIREKLIKEYKLINPFIIDPDEYYKYDDNVSYENISLITKDIEIYAINRGFNIVFDKVYSYIKDLEKLINLLKLNNYKIIFNLIYVDLKTAIDRNKTRARIPLVKPNIIKNKFNEIKNNDYTNILKKVNIVKFYSNNILVYYKNNDFNFYFNY